MNLPLLKELTEAHGTSGREEAIQPIAVREMSPLGEVTVDRLGSVACLKRGKGKIKLMLAAHMDEIGFIVKFIESNGFLRIQPIGGWDPRQMNSQRVIVSTRSGPLNGLMMYGTKPAHLLSDSEKSEGQKVELFFIDLGLSADEVKSKVKIGDPITMDRGFLQRGNHLTCKSMDDRVGLFVMIEALRAVNSHEVDVYAVATVQEEVGLRGAAAAASSIAPDIAIALDITLANDIPGVPETDQITMLGGGAAIKVMDSSLICHPKLVDHFVALAEKHGIPYQMEVLSRGGTDAGAIQRLHGGIPSFTLSIPTRYTHTVNETVDQRDVQACIDLLARYIEEAHLGEYNYSPA